MTFRCPECGDEMSAKFQHTHPVLCRIATLLAAATVERLLDDLGLDQP